MSWPSPVFPDAPGTFETGMATPRIGWACWPIVRAMASAPPPAPHVTMKSIGRDGYFSWAPAAGSPTRIIHAEMKTHHARPPGILRFALIAPPPPSRAPTSALNLPNVRQNLLAQGHELRAGLDGPARPVAGLPTERGLDRGQNAPRPRRHDENPCAEIAGLLHAVGDEEHGLPGGLPDLKQLFLEMLARQRIQGAEGLVHQEDPGIVDEDPGDGYALLHAARQLIGGLGAKVPQPHHAEVGLRQLPPPRRRQPPPIGRGPGRWLRAAACRPTAHRGAWRESPTASPCGGRTPPAPPAAAPAAASDRTRPRAMATRCCMPPDSS